MRTKMLIPMAWCLLSTGCSDQVVVENTDRMLSVVVAAQSANQCVQTGNKNADFPPDVDRIEVRLSGANETFSTVVNAQQPNTKGQVLITRVPTGEKLTLDLFGCAGSELTWSGRAPNVTITKHEKTAPALYFTKKNTFNCAGSEIASPSWASTLPSARTLHRAVTTHDNQLLLVGGFDTYEPKTGQLIASKSAPSSIVQFRPSIGMFRSWSAQLSQPRGWHHLVPVDGGRRILVLGGVTKAQVQGLDNPPIAPARGSDGKYEPGTIPTPAAEVVDVIGKTTYSSGLDVSVLPMSAVAHSKDGLGILIIGGESEADGEPSTSIQRIESADVDSLTSNSKDAATPVVTGNLLVPRKGHTATWFDYGALSYALVVGGNFDEDPSHIAEIVFKKPNGGKIGSAFPKVEFADGDQPLKPMAFHETALARVDTCRFLFLVAGGQEIKRSNGGAIEFVPPDLSTGLLHLLEVDVCDNKTATARFRSQTALIQLEESYIRSQRTLHSLTPLGDSLFLLGGGVHQFNVATTPDPLCFEDRLKSGCYLADNSVIQLVGAGVGDATLALATNDPLTYSSSRFGHNVVLLPDGTAMASGGMVAHDDKGGNLLNDAELFNPLRANETAQSICQ